jgi:hypothetical protein
VDRESPLRGKAQAPHAECPGLGLRVRFRKINVESQYRTYSLAGGGAALTNAGEFGTSGGSGPPIKEHVGGRPQGA